MPTDPTINPAPEIQPLIITKLQAENFKRLRAVEITPEGNLIEITGRNAQGKSSVLDSIMAALAGGKALPDKPLRNGAKKGKITVSLGDLIATRTISPSGSTLTVTGKDGANITSPQAVLDKLTGQIAFDPLSFMRLDAKKQREQLIQIVDLGFDPVALAAQEADTYTKRRDAGRDADKLKAALDGTPKPAAKAFVNPEPLQAAMREAQQQQADFAKRDADLKAEERMLTAEEARLKNLLGDIEAAEKHLVELKKRHKDGMLAYNPRCEAMHAAVQALAPPAMDIQARSEALTAALENNAQVGATAAYDVLAKDTVAARKVHDDLDRKLEALREKRETALAGVAMPVDGLSFTDEGLLYNKIPLEQCSASEQLRVSVAIAMALNPKLHVILIRDGSVLDTEGKVLLCQMARDKGYQVWLEAVDESGKVGIVIEDGMVAGADAPIEDAPAEVQA